MGITHAKTSAIADGSDPTQVQPSDWNADHGITSYIEFPESTTPSTPASTKARLYVKSDGRFYSMGDDGVEHGPFDAAGTDLSGFRLPSGMADSPSDLALGAYGDEFEYATHTALAAAWTAQGISRLYAAGSAAVPHLNGQAYVLHKATTGFDATNWEIGFLLSGMNVNQGGMFGPGVYDNSGNGTAVSPYSDGNSYSWAITGWGYTGTGTPGGVNYTSHTDGRPVWYFLKKAGTTYRLRMSVDMTGPTITTVVGSFTGPSSPTRIGFGRHFSGGAIVDPLIHRFVYGTPTLGLG